MRNFLTVVDGCFNCVTSHVKMLGWLEKKKEEEEEGGGGGGGEEEEEDRRRGKKD